MKLHPSMTGVPLFEQGRCYRRYSFFAYTWKLPAYSEVFLLTFVFGSLFTDSWSLFTYSWSLLLTIANFMLTMSKCVL